MDENLFELTSVLGSTTYAAISLPLVAHIGNYTQKQNKIKNG